MSPTSYQLLYPATLTLYYVNIYIISQKILAVKGTAHLFNSYGGGGWIRTSEGFAGRFTVCSL